MILVTGATGNVGSAVLADLADKPVNVRAFVRDPARLTVRAPNIEVVQGDFANEGDVRRALDGVDVAFLASNFSPSMVDLQSRFIALAKITHVRRLVHLSGVGANMSICCARALRWLGQLEATAADSGMTVTNLRATFFMQNLLQFASTIKQQGIIAGPFRSGRWTFVDARDVGAVGAVALLNEQHDGKTYVVTGSEALSYQEVAERLSKKLDKSVRYLDITANEARGRLQATGSSPVMVEATLELWDACASNLINVAPTSVVRDLTGRAPRSLEDFVADHRSRFA
jgi:uncharacterized protein YbjT (DUF2867 family)